MSDKNLYYLIPQLKKTSSSAALMSPTTKSALPSASLTPSSLLRREPRVSIYTWGLPGVRYLEGRSRGWLSLVRLLRTLRY